MYYSFGLRPAQASTPNHNPLYFIQKPFGELAPSALK